ncbi:MAG: hypothetical protein JWO98_2458 [Frankiales bacterium]|nr:hypothetical protein [Frankiales bacterium]
MIGVLAYVALVLLWTSAWTTSPIHHSPLTGKAHDDELD